MYRNEHWNALDKCDRLQQTAGLLNIFFGVLGVDQLWAGNIGLGLGKLFTLGGLGFWTIADIFLWATGNYYAIKGCPNH